MLSEQFEKLKNTLPVSYNPFPQLDDRSFWDSVSNTVKNIYISKTEMYMKKDFPVLTAAITPPMNGMYKTEFKLI